MTGTLSDAMKEYIEVIEATPLTPNEFAAAMAKLKVDLASDKEAMHFEMDRLMCGQLRALGYSDGIEIFEVTDRWYA